MEYTLVNGYELLLTMGDFGCSESISHARLRASYGQGYKSSVIVDGAITGLKSWKLTYKTLIQTLDKVGYIEEDAFKQADYFWDFYCRYQVSGTPFVIKSLRNRQYYLAEFTDDILSLELFATRLFTTGINLEQRRIEGDTVFDMSLVDRAYLWYDASQLDLTDGSVVTTLPDLIDTPPPDSTPPSAPEGFTLEFDEDWIGECEPAEDEESEIIEYILTLSWP